MTDAASETLCDPMDPARIAALHATLGLERDPAAPVLPFGHQVYFWDARPPAALGRDGHPRPGLSGGAIPDMGLPRRMWAGGRLAFHAPLFTGRPATKTTVAETTRRTTGRSGPLAFVTLRHEIAQDGRPCVTEWQDLVYRADPDPLAPRPAPPQAPDAAEEQQAAVFSPLLLFRYSALTFNGHRIHYDRVYATGTEGYPGLVVHGPLLAQLLVLMAERALGGRLARFAFRAVSPLTDHETATLCRSGGRLWVRGPDGRLCMEAEAG